MNTIFRELSAEEEIEFRQWARDNHTPGELIKDETWHPAVVSECMEMDREANIPSKLDSGIDYTKDMS